MFTLCNVKCEHEFYSHFVKCEHGFLFHSFPIIVVFNNGICRYVGAVSRKIDGGGITQECEQNSGRKCS